MNFFLARYGFIPIKVNFLFFINLNFILGLIWQKNNFSILIPIILITNIYFIKIFIFNENIKEKTTNYLFIVFSFFLGIFLYDQQQQKFDNFQKIVSSKKYSVIGKIKDINHLIDSKMKYRITFEIEKMKDIKSNELININNTIQIFANNIGRLEIDDKVEIKEINFKNTNNNSSYRYFLIKENLFASLFIYKFYFRIIEKQKFSVAKYLNNLKTRIINNLQSKIKSTTFALFSSIFLGNKNCSKNDLENIKDLFKTWGLSHYLARSGLHLVIISSIWYILMSLLFISFYIKNIFIFLLIYLYHLLSWPSIPFVRSLFMFTLYKICNLFDLQINALHLLNITTFTILTFNPIQLFFLDFQLSFSLTYAIIWLSNITSKNKNNS